ncbi:MAG TPA: dienelactone hydrolase family protein [Usitatibacter sp.]|nr:dienelactone hydrolase family protein [Usitatibacter sp.]
MNLRAAACTVCSLLAAGAAHAFDTISFPSLDADLTAGKPTTIEAALFKPSGAGPFPAVVLLHGCGGLYHWKGRQRGQLTSRHEEWAERLVKAGYVVLLPDSFAPRGVHESCTVKDRPVDSSRERPRDAYGALQWLQAQPYVKANRVALMGWSNGGGTVLHTVAAASPARPAALPMGDFRAAVAFYPGCSSPKEGAHHSGHATSTSSSAWRTRIPLMIMQGEADDWTPAAPCHDLVAAAAARGEPIEYHGYPGAYHDFDAPNEPVRTRSGLARAPSGIAHVGTNAAARDDAFERVPNFLREQLGT